jgi:hypothetical protein
MKPKRTEHGNGSITYRVKDLLHSEEHPAVQRTDGYQAWYRHGMKHREDSPAVTFGTGAKQYWLRGKKVTKAVAQDGKLRTMFYLKAGVSGSL